MRHHLHGAMVLQVRAQRCLPLLPNHNLSSANVQQIIDIRQHVVENMAVWHCCAMSCMWAWASVWMADGDDMNCLMYFVCNTLMLRMLYLVGIWRGLMSADTRKVWFCETAHFEVQNGPFRGVKRPESRCEMGRFANRCLPTTAMPHASTAWRVARNERPRLLM